MRVFACQTDIVWEDKAGNFDRVRAMLDAADVPPSSLVVLPELFATGFSMDVDKIAEPPGGEIEAFLCDLALGLKSTVVGGVATRGSDGRVRNESVVVGPDGRLAGRYAKLFPFTLGGESRHYTAGEDVLLLPCGEFTISPFVCYDLRFPEAFRRAARRGANLFTVIASWPLPRDAHWLALLRARAIENQSYVIGVNRTGTDPKHVYPGRSLIVDPHGNALAEADATATVLTANLAIEPLVEFRRAFPALADMRDDFVR